MSYSDVSSLDAELREIPFHEVKEGQSILYQGAWYKALEDSHINEGMIGFRAENEDFEETVIQFAKADLAYAPKLHTL